MLYAKDAQALVKDYESRNEAAAKTLANSCIGTLEKIIKDSAMRGASYCLITNPPREMGAKRVCEIVVERLREAGFVVENAENLKISWAD